MKKFAKNDKQKKVIIGSIIGMFVVIATVALFTSFASFTTTKEFNVIQGKIPNLNKGDIQFAYLVDGQASATLPEKDSGYHFAGSECTNGAMAIWNETNWNVSVNNLKTTGTLCKLKFDKKDFTNDFSYGDGSLNTISRACTAISAETGCVEPSGEGGYINKLAIYDTSLGRNLELNEITTEKNIYTGNFYNLNNLSESEIVGGNSIYVDDADRINTIWLKAGENVSYLNQSIKGDENSIIRIYISWSNSGAYREFSNFQIMLDGQYYTLKDAISNHKIKPIVIMNSGANNDIYLINNLTNLYDGGEIAGNFSDLNVYFMLEKDVRFIRYKINSKSELTGWAGGDAVVKINNKIMYLK